jgi:hypothetical protein
MECALELARAGYLVIASLCAGSCVDALRRLLISCPSLQLPDGRDALAADLVAVVCLKLLPKATGKGRALATEVLAADSEVRSFIRTGCVDRIAAHLRSGSASAESVTLDQALADLFNRRLIEYSTAVAHCDDPEEIFRRLPTPTSNGLSSLRSLMRRIRARTKPLPSRPWSRQSMLERFGNWCRGRRFQGRAQAPRVNLIRQHLGARSMLGLLSVISEEARIQLGLLADHRPERPVAMPWHRRNS